MPGLAERALGMATGRTLVVRHDATSPLPPAVTIWQRVWAPDAAARVWPDGGPYDTVILPLPRGKEALHLCLHACASVLAANGTVLLYGENDMGIKSANKAASAVFADVTNIYTGDHGRIWKLAGPAGFKTAISDFITGKLPFQSLPGVFAGGQLDDATALLIQNLPDIKPGAAVLDFACGIGLLAGSVLYRQEKVVVTAVDHDPLALHATMLNVPQAKPVLTGRVSDVTGTYDLIVSNPPIHEGNAQSYRIIGDLIAALPRLLTAQGAAYIVAQGTVPVARLAKDAGLACEEVAATRSFRVSRIRKA